jgi:hypothetical protein
LKIRQVVRWNPDHAERTEVLLKIEVPAHFPAKYEKAIGRAADNCLVAKLGRGLKESMFKRTVSRRTEN